MGFIYIVSGPFALISMLCVYLFMTSPLLALGIFAVFVVINVALYLSVKFEAWNLDRSSRRSPYISPPRREGQNAFQALEDELNAIVRPKR